MPRNDVFESDPQGNEEESDDLPADIDLDELAKEVFKLLLQEFEIENERTGRILTR